MSGAIIAMVLCDPATLDAVRGILATIRGMCTKGGQRYFQPVSWPIHQLAQSYIFVSALVYNQEVSP